MARGVASVHGTEYALPALELEFAVTRRLVDCESAAAIPGVAPAVAPAGQPVAAVDSNRPVVPQFEVKIEPKQEFVASEIFEMDYTDLAAPWKTSSFKVEWHDNGMLKSINVQATDKSADIIVESLKAGLTIARLAGGIPPGGGDLGSRSTPVCPVEVEIRKSLVELRKAATKLLTQHTAVVQSFKDRDVTALSDTEKKQLGDALAGVKGQTQALAELDKKLADLDKVLAYSETVRWRPPTIAGATTNQTQPFPFELVEGQGATVEEAARVKWLARLFSIDNLGPLGRKDPACVNIDDDHDGNPDSFACWLKQSLAFVVMLDPEPVNASSAQLEATRKALGISAPRSSTRATRDHVQGVVTRMPVRSRFFACSGTIRPCHRGSPDKLFDQLVSVPQFGHYLVLPFSNGFGQDNELTANFAENGRPTMVEYKDKQAAALVAAQAVNHSAGLLLGYAEDVRAFREAEETEEEGAALRAAESQVKLLEQQKKVIDLQAAIDPANVDLLAQRARLEQDLAIAKLERDIATVDGEVAALDAQLSVQPGDLALAAEKDRLATLQAVMRSRVEIRALCAANPGVAGCE